MNLSLNQPVHRQSSLKPQYFSNHSQQLGGHPAVSNVAMSLQQPSFLSHQHQYQSNNNQSQKSMGSTTRPRPRSSVPNPGLNKRVHAAPSQTAQFPRESNAVTRNCAINSSDEANRQFVNENLMQTGHIIVTAQSGVTPLAEGTMPVLVGQHSVGSAGGAASSQNQTPVMIAIGGGSGSQPGSAQQTSSFKRTGTATLCVKGAMHPEII